MKSKTFCFNRTIFKKNFTHFWPIWALYLAYLLIAMPVNVWQMATANWYYNELDLASKMYSIVQEVVRNQLLPQPTFLAAAVVALAVFSYLYSAKNANMIHALPVNRLELYITNYLSGLAFLIVPEVIAFLVTVLVCLTNEITCIQYLFIGLLGQMGLTFFAYSLAVFVAMFTGQIFAMPFYYLIVNYLYVGCLFLVSEIISLINYGVENAWNPGKSCILSPIYYLGNNLWSRLLYEEKTDVVNGIEIQGMHLVGIYAVAAVVIVVAAYQLYKRRQIETAGDWVAIGVVKPVFRWGVAICGGVFFGIGFTSLLMDSRSIDIYLCVMAFTVVTGSVCFFAAEMLLQKNFRVFKKKRLMEWAGFLAVTVCFLTMFRLDVFGIEKRIPKEDEIEAAFVYMDYPIRVDEADIPKLLDIHRKAIENKKEYQSIEKTGEGFYYTTFRYYLKDGTELERRYPLSISQECIEDETAPSGQILAWERETDQLKRCIMGYKYEENIYVSGYIDLYDEEGNYSDYMLDRDEIEQIVAAVEKDIEEGNFDAYYLPSMQAEGVTEYYNSINLDYSNRAQYYDSWEYYYYYREHTRQEEAGERVVSGSSYIRFGSECTNLIKTLENLGITNDTWRLCTYDEVEERWNE